MGALARVGHRQDLEKIRIGMSDKALDAAFVSLFKVLG